MSTIPVPATDIRDNVNESLQQRIRLQEQGRGVLTQDSYNTEWPDATAAFDAAIEAFDHALNAMTWVETLPHLDGDYTPLAN